MRSLFQAQLILRLVLPSRFLRPVRDVTSLTWAILMRIPLWWRRESAKVQKRLMRIALRGRCLLEYAQTRVPWSLEEWQILKIAVTVQHLKCSKREKSSCLAIVLWQIPILLGIKTNSYPSLLNPAGQSRMRRQFLPSLKLKRLGKKKILSIKKNWKKKLKLVNLKVKWPTKTQSSNYFRIHQQRNKKKYMKLVRMR